MDLVTVPTRGQSRSSAWIRLDDFTRVGAGESARELAGSRIPQASKRWRHVQTAAEAAAEAARVLGADDGALLVDAAWLHDIGYHHPTAPTGFHPLDGAQLVTEAGWSVRIAALVAHHSEARFMAAARGWSAALEVWPRERGMVTDGLVYADMTSAPGGGRTWLRERLIDVRRRHAREGPERASARPVLYCPRPRRSPRRACHRSHSCGVVFPHARALESGSRHRAL